MFSTSKNVLLIIVFLSFIAKNSFGQEVYMGIKGGYNLPFGSNYLLANNYYSYSVSTNSVKNETSVVKGSFGSGVTSSVFIDIFLNESIGLGVEGGFLKGNEYKAQEIYSYWFGKESYTDKYGINSLLINPSLIFRAKGERVIPYAKFGIIMSKSHLKYEFRYEFSSSEPALIESTSMEFSSLIKNKFDYGASSLIGVNFLATEHIAFNVNVNFNLLEFSPYKEEIKTYSIDGEDQMHTLVMSEKEIEYQENYDEYFQIDENGKLYKETSDILPGTSSPFNMPMHSFGMNIGVCYKF